MAVSGYIITAWAKDGRLAVARCKDPSPLLPYRDGMIEGWIVRDTARAMGRDTFGEAFSHEGPSACYHLKPERIEGVPGGYAISSIASCEGMDRDKATAMVAEALAGPEVELELRGAVQTLQICGAVMNATRELKAHSDRLLRRF